MRIATAALAAVLLLPACDTSGDPEPSAAPTTSTPSSTTATPTATVPGSNGAASAAVVAAVARFGKAKLGWDGCDDGFECADLTVPLDYDAPDGDTIEIAVIRLKARQRSRRIGSLVLNPGGPGGSGVDFARQARQLLPGEILDRFDVVSFDPRGVGESSPVDCLGDDELDRLLAVDPSPDNAAERTRLLTLSRDEAVKCGQRSGKLLPHLGTIDAAKDMDVLRTALGDPKLTYVGFSYGTILGARYAQQFPDKVRALVLDGAVDPILTPRETAAAQALGFERALDAFFRDCVKQDCAFGRHGEIGKTYDDLMARIDRSPLPASNYPGREAGPSEALFGVAAGLYSREFGWPVLRQALEAAYNGDGSVLLALFDSLVERDERGRYSNSVEAQAAVSCVDGVYADDPLAYDADAVQFERQSPRFGRALAYGPVVCAYWPVPPVTKPGAITVENAPPIVVIGTTRDPATPYDWAESLASQLPGVLVTYDGDGHTAYGYSRSSCVNKVVDAYLIALTVPKPRTRCT